MLRMFVQWSCSSNDDHCLVCSIVTVNAKLKRHVQQIRKCGMIAMMVRQSCAIHLQCKLTNPLFIYQKQDKTEGTKIVIAY